MQLACSSICTFFYFFAGHEGDYSLHSHSCHLYLEDHYVVKYLRYDAGTETWEENDFSWRQQKTSLWSTTSWWHDPSRDHNLGKRCLLYSKHDICRKFDLDRNASSVGSVTSLGSTNYGALASSTNILIGQGGKIIFSLGSRKIIHDARGSSKQRQ